LLWEQDVVGSNPACPIKMKKRNRDYSAEYKRRHNENKLWYIPFMKDKKCSVCGINDSRVLDWHHRDHNEKEYGIADMLSRYSKAAILAEISKCVCVCKNCHAIIHHEEKGKIRKVKKNLVKLDI
jgi:hypothetical protein